MREDRKEAVLSYAPLRNPSLGEVTYCAPSRCTEFGSQHLYEHAGQQTQASVEPTHEADAVVDAEFEVKR